MIGLEDRQTMVQHIKTAHTAGARLRPACEIAGISVRTFERWCQRRFKIDTDFLRAAI